MPGDMLRGWEGKSILPSVAEASVDSKSWEQMTSSHTKDLRRCHNRKDYQKMDALSITGGVLRLQRWKGKLAPTGPRGGGTQGCLHEVLADPLPLPAGFLHESSLIPKRERTICMHSKEGWREFASMYWSSWRRQWHPTPVLLPGKSHGRRSLVGCRLWGRTESDTTEAT